MFYFVLERTCLSANYSVDDKLNNILQVAHLNLFIYSLTFEHSTTSLCNERALKTSGNYPRFNLVDLAALFCYLKF